jgi:predicted Zn finger-like uncharacterized protein
MALATQCPHCQTIFRVANDQLKLRAGLVRCGRCKEVFNGIEHLLPAEATAPVAPPIAEAKPIPSEPPPQAAAPRADPPPEPEPHGEFIDFFDLLNKPAEAAPAPQDEVPAAAQPDADDPLQRMTLVNLHEDQPEAAADNETRAADEAESLPPAPVPVAEMDPNAPDPLDKAIEDLHRKPPRVERRARPRRSEHKPHRTEADEPSFVKSGRRRERFGRALRAVYGIGGALLLIGALGQGAYLARSQIAAQWPQARPALEQACAALGCKVGLPAQIDAVAIEASELQTTSAKDTFLLSALLRNKSGTAQEWPAIELTLNDASDKPLARRVFAPRDYVRAPQALAKGIDPSSEQPVRIYLDLGQVKASGYRVYLFYP